MEQEKRRFGVIRVEKQYEDLIREEAQKTGRTLKKTIEIIIDESRLVKK